MIIVTRLLSSSSTQAEQSAEEQLKQLSTSPPVSVLEQVPWALGVIYEAVKLLGYETLPQ